MYIVFRVINSDYVNKELVAICSDLCIAEDFVKRMVLDKTSCDCAMYVIGSVEDV